MFVSVYKWISGSNGKSSIVIKQVVTTLGTTAIFVEIVFILEY